ncbi:hypothetical protein GCM10027037_25150 [Mucilaginibacter koreensis]
MKRILLFLSFIIIVAGCTQAQTPAEVRAQHLAPYRILTTDSTWSTPAQLKKNRPVMLVYFSPDCGHCQRLMYEMKPKMKQFGNTQIVLITFTQYRSIKDFYKAYGLSAFPNITVGTEGYTYNVQRYYEIKTTPFVAIYDRNGKLVKIFDKQPNVDDLIATAKKA